MVEPGEQPDEGARREVQEETGLHVELRGALGEIEYWFVDRATGSRVHKTVHHFLFEAIGGSLDDHDHEIKEARWFEAEEALRSIEYANERAILERAIQATARLAAERPGGEP
jgi:8-oxo-dGTP pyrophosphatase MutT (NUDIX family)